MSEGTKRRVVEGYAADKAWSKVLEALRRERILDEKEGLTDTPNNLMFELEDGLIYHKDVRLCLPPTFEKEMFEQCHDKRAHVGYHRTFECITESLYFNKLAKRLRTYLQHCPVCQLLSVKRHKPYGQLQHIDTPQQPYHSIAMDFVVDLPQHKHGYNVLLIMTYKALKKISLI